MALPHYELRPKASEKSRYAELVTLLDSLDHTGRLQQLLVDGVNVPDEPSQYGSFHTSHRF